MSDTVNKRSSGGMPEAPAAIARGDRSALPAGGCGSPDSVSGRGAGTESKGLLQGRGIAVIVVAGGSGTRMRRAGTAGDVGALPKQFLPLGGVPVLVRTLERLMEALPAACFTVVLPLAHIPRWEALCREWKLPAHTVCEGGATRFDSVRNALRTAGGCGYIAVHDGVRPLVSAELVHEAVATAADFGTAVPVIEPADSFRMVTECGSQPVDRTALRAVQTPQVFRADILHKAYGAAYDPCFTDDASVVERSGVAVRLCTGRRGNLKITTPEDMIVAEALLNFKSAAGGGVIKGAGPQA